MSTIIEHKSGQKFKNLNYEIYIWIMPKKYFAKLYHCSFVNERSYLKYIL